MTDPDIEAACEDITKGFKTHRGCSPGSDEALARKLCELDGWSPDATGTFGVKVVREGRLTDTGHDTRKGTVEDVDAPPMWTMYIHKARKLRDFLGVAQGSPDRDEIAKPQERTYTLAEVSDTVERVIRKMLDDGQIAASPVSSTPRETPELADRWPLGCHSPNSCSRNGRCMYFGCRHDGKDIKALATAFSPAERGTP